MKTKAIKKTRSGRLGARAIASMAVLALVFALVSVVVIQLLSELALS
jgi:hypothetical protein